MAAEKNKKASANRGAYNDTAKKTQQYFSRLFWDFLLLFFLPALQIQEHTKNIAVSVSFFSFRTFKAYPEIWRALQ